MRILKETDINHHFIRHLPFLIQRCGITQQIFHILSLIIRCELLKPFFIGPQFSLRIIGISSVSNISQDRQSRRIPHQRRTVSADTGHLRWLFKSRTVYRLIVGIQSDIGRILVCCQPFRSGIGYCRSRIIDHSLGTLIFITPDDSICNHIIWGCHRISCSIGLGFITYQITVHQINHRSSITCNSTTRTRCFVIGKQRIDRIQGCRLGICSNISGYIDTAAPHIFRLGKILYRTITGNHTAYKCRIGITHIHTSSTHGPVIHQTAAVQRVVHTIGIDSTASSYFIRLRRRRKFRKGLTVHNRQAIKRNISLTTAVHYVVYMFRGYRHIQFTGQNGMIGQFPRFQNRVTVQVRIPSGIQHVLYISIGAQFDITGRGRNPVDSCRIVFLTRESAIYFHILRKYKRILALVKDCSRRIHTPHTRLIDTGTEQDLEYGIFTCSSNTFLTHPLDVFYRIVQMVQ